MRSTGVASSGPNAKAVRPKRPARAPGRPLCRIHQRRSRACIPLGYNALVRSRPQHARLARAAAAVCTWTRTCSSDRRGNRSALEWVIDYCNIKAGKRGGIVNDPSRPDDPQYILCLLAKVISVSLETVDIVEKLPALGIEEAEPVAEATGLS